MKKQNEGKPNIFGVRHFSPAGAHYLRDYLDEIQPKIVLIEGPSDFNDLISEITGENIVPPIAVMAYTLEAPIQTIVYPFAEFSPEYQAILWAKENGVECRFCDLPSSIFLGVESVKKNLDDQKLTHDVLLSKYLIEIIIIAEANPILILPISSKA